MKVYSYSRLSLYETCPRRFCYKYVFNWKDPPGEAAILGKTVHKANELILNGRSFDDAVLTACMEEADMAVDRQEVEMLVKRAVSFSRNCHIKIQGIEKYFMMELSEIIIEHGKGALCQGYIDLFCRKDEIPVMLDWKTNYIPYNIFATQQMPLYAAAVMEQTGMEKVEAILVFLRSEYVSRAVITKDMAKRAKKWAAQAAEEIQQKLELIKTSDPLIIFPSRLSVSCGYCPWCYQCLTHDKGGVYQCLTM